MGGSWLDKGRKDLADSVRARIAGPDFQAAHTRIWDTPGPRWFTPDDPIWRVYDDTATFVGAIRALLLQSLHPTAMIAVSRHSGFRGDTWGRLQRTSHFLATTTFGTIEAAERSVAQVRSMHTRVSGVTADGASYRADDPDLLAWVHLAQVDSFLASHQAFGRAPLTAAEADRYVAQTSVVARKLGVVHPPQTAAEMRAGLAAYRDCLRFTDEAREAADLLLRDPPLPGLSRVGYGMLAAGAVSTLPAWARATLRLPTLPLADRFVARPAARTALGTIRWALAAPDAA